MAPAETRRPIVVGVAPESSQRTALAWAADEAARRRVPLRLVHAEGVPTGGYRKTAVRPSWEEWSQALHETGERVLKEAVAFAEARQPQVELSAVLAEGSPAWVLREEAHDAAAVVLGSSHLSRIKEVFSAVAVTLPVMAHARCPVVVVPEAEHLTGQPLSVVVGVDGSPYSASAVDFAFQEAALHGAALRALYVRQSHRFGLLDEQAMEQECRRLLSETVAGRTASYPEVELHHEVVTGHPVEELIKASARALALVVGTRGHGGFTGMLLGSVSQGVVHFARCPVIAVPPSRTPGA
ncbi:universal stress protein [Streptomyces albospinus]|uniref:Universal stress protein n=1 Tax=Streptomyces albospinus TaxID=285515 RepID=A0ABQ2VK34_9ACTN|nr:universal stress protein [Streptomyces albospinus]GGU91497.1 universal stress protein [Streptomyces albospinus]